MCCCVHWQAAALRKRRRKNSSVPPMLMLTLLPPPLLRQSFLTKEFDHETYSIASISAYDAVGSADSGGLRHRYAAAEGGARCAGAVPRERKSGWRLATGASVGSARSGPMVDGIQGPRIEQSDRS